MARINKAQNEVEATETVVTLASLGLMCCMVVTLMGIKIWWFKHRLSFEQSSTSNGAAGGTQPRIVTRTRSSKDKRLSQQFREPVVVHGVFRKRQEDELETLERSKPLPPIRQQKLSQSTPELFQPPFRPALKQEVESEFLNIPAPPTREPPIPPTRLAPEPPKRQAQTPAPLTNPSPAPLTFEEIEARPTINSTPLIEEPDEKAVEFHSSEEEAEEEDEREDAFIRPKTPELKAEQAPKSRAPKPLQRNRSHNLEGVERRFLRAKTTSFEKCKPSVSLMERRATGFQRPDELKWQEFQEDEVDHSSGDHRREEGQLRKWEDLESYSDEMLNLEEHHFDIQKFNNKNVVFQVIDPADHQYEEEEEQEHYSTWTLKRRPTGYATGAPVPLTDLDCEEEEPPAQHLNESEKLWQEMERDIDRDFASNIEEEFNKIRHSYEANEEGFLEESTNELDTGYGKSIDEDWESFEKLDNSDSKIEPEIPERNLRAVKADLSESDESLESKTQQQKVLFQLSDDYKEDASDEERSESSKAQIRQRRPTGFERNSIEPKLAELVENDANEAAATRAHKVSFQLSDEDEMQENEDEEDAKTIIKQRRPTGYVKREDYANLLLETDDESAEEQEVEVDTFKTDTTIKPKPRQKVTFNFTTQIREHDVDEILADEEMDNEQPTPMQRMTKMNNSNDLVAAKTENTAALLFSTQVSAEYASAEEGCNDSWSAIRLHRQLTDEFQQLTLQESEERAAPKAAYRNPLAQFNSDNGQEEFVITAKPRTMRDMKKAQARQTMHVKQYDGSATEA